jgi:lysozyme
MQLRGIDVSHYQGAVDWFAVEQGGLAFAFAKATEGTTGVDDEFARNWGAIREAGLFRGAYHFGRPGSDPDAQAVHFASVVGALGFRDMPPVLDLEEADGHDADHVIDWAHAFADRAEALFQRRLLLYTGGFWRSQLGNRTDPFFAARPLWLAAYGKNPVIPAPWKAWTFWQYSDGRYNDPVQIPGVRGAVDQSLFAGDDAALSAFCDGAVLEVGPPPLTPPIDGSTWPETYFVWPHTPPISDESVKKWQARVRELGFPIDVDGIYGPESKGACRAFQRDRGLVADGIVGRLTWEACFAG